MVLTDPGPGQAGEPHQDQVFHNGAEGLNIELSAEWLVRLRSVGGTREPLLYRHAGPAVTALIADGRLPDELAPFRPSRFDVATAGRS